jgi:hypothetical protein
VSEDNEEDLRSLFNALDAGIREAHYQAAHDAAANICSGVSSTVPVDLHDVVHEAVMAGYATALSDLEEGKLDDQVRGRADTVE